MTERGAMGGRSEGPSGETRRRSGGRVGRAGLFVLLTVAGLWLLLSGPLTFHHTLLLGFWPASCALVVWLCHRLGIVTDDTLPLELAPRALSYIPWLGVQVVRSSLAVLRSVWWPGAGIDPTTARISSSTRTDLGLVLYANSITLTPGTLSLAAESAADGGPSVLVHALDREGLEALRAGAMDARVHRLEATLPSRPAAPTGDRD